MIDVILAYQFKEHQVDLDNKYVQKHALLPEVSSVDGLVAVAVVVGEVTSTKYVGKVYTNNTKTIPKFSAHFHISYFPYVNTIIYLSTFG